MKQQYLIALVVMLNVALLASCQGPGPVDASGRPKIVKHGCIDCDLVETTPVVFNNRAYRFEYVRPDYWDNKMGNSYFRFIDIKTGKPTPAFAAGYHMGSAFVDGDTVYVSGVDNWNSERIDIFASTDLKNWEKWNALNLPGNGIFNSSICKAGNKYVIMYEIGKPKELAGEEFTAQFAESTDLKTWRVFPPECNYAQDRYTAPHCIRYLDGYFYVFYLESLKNPRRFHSYVVRSKDFIHWQSSPLNPVLEPTAEDKVIANPNLPEEQKERIRISDDCNTSDIDFCEFKGRLIINYSWGNQKGKEFLAEASYNGTEDQFLRGWFPK